MRPQTSGVMLASFVSIVPWSILVVVLVTNPDSVFSGKTLDSLVILLMLVGLPFLFYSLVIYEFRKWNRDIETYKMNGTFKALAAEFKNASPCFNRQRLRLGSRHIFCQGVTTAVAYDDILAINVRHNRRDREVTISASVKGEKLPVLFRSVKWRSSDTEIQSALSAISKHNPDIIIKRSET